MNILVTEGLGACRFRGHRMHLVEITDRGERYVCEGCYRQMLYTPEPRPNEIKVSGEALAVSCDTPSKSYRSELDWVLIRCARNWHRMKYDRSRVNWACERCGAVLEVGDVPHFDSFHALSKACKG